MSAIEAPRGWRIGAPGGVPIHLSPTWPILLVVIVVSFGPQIARAVPGLGAAGAYVVSGVYALLLFVSVLAHEGAHAVGARAMGARVGHIVIDVFGGHTTYEASRLTPARSALIAVVGPLANGVLAVAGWAALGLLPEGVPRLLGLAFVLTNAVVGGFNLVPGHPLDGGHLLDALVWQLTGRRHLGLLVSGWAGRLMVVGLVTWLVVMPLLAGDRPSFVILAWTGLLGAMLWVGASQAVRSGRDMRAYARVDLRSVLAPVLVIPGEESLTSVAERAAQVRSDADRAPVVLVETATGLQVLTRPLGHHDQGADPSDAAAADHASTPPAGWMLDVRELPTLADVVDHMHEHACPLVVLRRDHEFLGAISAGTVTQAMRGRR